MCARPFSALSQGKEGEDLKNFVHAHENVMKAAAEEIICKHFGGGSYDYYVRKRLQASVDKDIEANNFGN